MKFLGLEDAWYHTRFPWAVPRLVFLESIKGLRGIHLYISRAYVLEHQGAPEMLPEGMTSVGLSGVQPHLHPQEPQGHPMQRPHL